jgi:pilus assembly protein CpaB
MRNKFIPLAVALIFGSIAAVGFSKMNKAAPEAETVEIYVAAHVIEQAAEVKEDAVKLELWPAKNVPEDAVRSWDDLKGKFVSQRIYDGEPVMSRKLLDSKQFIGWIPKGFTTIDLDSNDASGIANLVAPGDRVNVIGFFAKRDLIPETTTRAVLSGIRVYAVDGETSREKLKQKEGRGAPKTVSLVMHPLDAEAWTWAKELGKVSLSLGRADESSVDETGPNPAGQAFLAWLSEQQAARNAVPEIKKPVAPVAEPEPAVEHQMVKVGPNGQTVIYTWEKGNPVPVITGTSAPAPAKPAAGTTAPQSAAGGADLEFLNGDDSPLYSDPEQDVSVNNPGYDPFKNMQQR